MKRRDFITLLGGAAAAWPLAGRAQEPGRTYRLGGLTVQPRTAAHYVAVFDELRRAGFVEGQNLVVGGWESRTEQFPEMAVQLVKAKVDVILCAGDPATRAERKTRAPCGEPPAQRVERADHQKMDRQQPGARRCAVDQRLRKRSRSRFRCWH